MSERKISAALKMMSDGLSLYHRGQTALDEILNEQFNGGVTDILNDDPDRQDALLTVTETITASAADVLSWGNEFDARDNNNHQPCVNGCDDWPCAKCGKGL